jgi:signal transduction histidine kinase
MLGTFGVIAILLACLQLLQLYEAGEIQDSIELIQKDALVSVRLIDRITRDVERGQVLVAQHIFERDLSTMLALERVLAKIRADYDEAAREYSPLASFSGEAVAWHELTSDVATARVQVDIALGESRLNHDVEATATINAAKPLFDRIDRGAEQLLDINQLAADRAAADARDRQHVATLFQLLVTAGILATVLVAGMWLTRTVVRVQHAMESLNGELENRNRELDAFGGRIAHDLRGPLNTVSLSAELIDLGKPESATAMTAAIRRAVGQIARLIDDLLALSRAGAMPRTAGRIELVASALREDLGRLVADAHGELHVDLEPAQVVCTEGLLRQALWNLGENAIKYRRPDVAPELEVAGRATPDHYTIRVSDNGVGMSADDARRAFEPFFRSAKTSSIAGTGLGLAIVRRIVEASGGRVSVDSTLGGGTTFVITLLLARGEPAERTVST